MLLRPWDTRLCALKLALHHAVCEGHEIEFARRRKLDDRPSDLLRARSSSSDGIPRTRAAVANA
jgi:hypothetical protein